MTEFKVVIDDAILPEEKRDAIGLAIQHAVLPHLADLGRGERPVVVMPGRPSWIGVEFLLADARDAG